MHFPFSAGCSAVSLVYIVLVSSGKKERKEKENRKTGKRLGEGSEGGRDDGVTEEDGGR